MWLFRSEPRDFFVRAVFFVFGFAKFAICFGSPNDFAVASHGFIDVFYGDWLDADLT